MPPNCPFVSHDSGLFHGTAETGSPLASTLFADGVGVELQPARSRTNGVDKRIKRRRIICLVKHRIAHLNIAFYIRQYLGHRIVGIGLGHAYLA